MMTIQFPMLPRIECKNVYSSVESTILTRSYYSREDEDDEDSSDLDDDSHDNDDDYEEQKNESSDLKLANR